MQRILYTEQNSMYIHITQLILGRQTEFGYSVTAQ